MDRKFTTSLPVNTDRMYESILMLTKGIIKGDLTQNHVSKYMSKITLCKIVLDELIHEIHKKYPELT